MFERSHRLDFELEIGIWIGKGNELGSAIDVASAKDHIAGYCLLNDWSARDIQAWEYQPLGPFLSKSFATTISPWIVTPEALAPFRATQPPRPEGDPPPLAYLADAEDQLAGALGIDLEVSLQTHQGRPEAISHSSASHMYWTPAQLVAHHSSNGCNLLPGDLLGTGTISGPDANSAGCLLEATRGGSIPIRMKSGEERYFLQDGDTVILRARCRREGAVPIGFGECAGTIVSAL